MVLKLLDMDVFMTVEEFMSENCALCGTQSCVCHLGIVDKKAISHCGRYHGEIYNIPKIKSLMEVFEEWKNGNKDLWKAIKARYKK